MNKNDRMSTKSKVGGWKLIERNKQSLSKHNKLKFDKSPVDEVGVLCCRFSIIPWLFSSFSSVHYICCWLMYFLLRTSHSYTWESKWKRVVSFTDPQKFSISISILDTMVKITGKSKFIGGAYDYKLFNEIVYNNDVNNNN